MYSLPEPPDACFREPETRLGRTMLKAGQLAICVHGTSIAKIEWTKKKKKKVHWIDAVSCDAGKAGEIILRLMKVYFKELRKSFE